MAKVLRKLLPVNKVFADKDRLKKSTTHIILDLIGYVRNSMAIKTILKKSTGNISVLSFDNGVGLTENIKQFDTYAQIIDGQAEMIINKRSYILKSGDSIIIPAFLASHIKPNGRFKMMQTVIKSSND